MKETMARLYRAVAAAFCLLGVWLGYWQVVAGPSLSQHPRNPRPVLALMYQRRGSILDRQGRPLATSEPRQVAEDGARPGAGWRVPDELRRVSYVRRYWGTPGLGPTIGYADPRLGRSGLELALDEQLGGGPASSWRRLLGPLLAGPRQGRDVVTTLDLRVQQAAERALGGQRGAVVALDPHSGEVLALASLPGFRPDQASRSWERLRSDPASPLLNRAVQGQYPPGSTFKVISLAAGLETGALRLDQLLPDEGAITVDGYTFHNYDEEPHGLLDPVEALVISSNVAYVQVGLRLGPEVVTQYARRFGLGQRWELPITVAAGRVPSPNQLSRVGLAEISIGQGSLLVTPLQMAVVAATVANGGVQVPPRLLKEPSPPESSPVRVVSAATARQVAEAMAAVVERGTGRGAALPGVRVAGKTGTAQNPHGADHAWFIGFAPVEAPRVAVAVVVENGGSGGAVAAPVARAVIQAALAAEGAGMRS